MLYFYLFVKKIERIYAFYRVFYHLWSIPIESGDRMSLSKKLSYFKRKEKLTTLEIAQRTSLPVGTLNKIFSGQMLSPSLKIIDRLSTLFHVPSHYLIDDEIPVGCSIGAYVESQGLLMLSERGGELFDLFRQLDEHNKQTIEWITRALARQSSKQKNFLLERRLLCYTPVAWGEYGQSLLPHPICACLYHHTRGRLCDHGGGYRSGARLFPRYPLGRNAQSRRAESARRLLPESGGFSPEVLLQAGHV